MGWCLFGAPGAKRHHQAKQQEKEGFYLQFPQVVSSQNPKPKTPKPGDFEAGGACMITEGMRTRSQMGCRGRVPESVDRGTQEKELSQAFVLAGDDT